MFENSNDDHLNADDSIKEELKEDHDDYDEAPNHPQANAMKKKRKIRNVKHSQQYYKEIKVARVNREKESGWNNRFILETIPDRVDPARSIHRSIKKALERQSSHKGSSQHLKKLTADQRLFQAPSKSFNVRITTRKYRKSDSKMPIGLSQQIRHSKYGQEADELKKALLSNLMKAYSQIMYSQCHHSILQDMVRNSKSKAIASQVHAQIARLKSRKSCCSRVEGAIASREELVKQINSKDQLQKQQWESIVQSYRTITLQVIEQILKWKDEIQTAYFEHTGNQVKFSFTFNGQSYLQKIGKDVNIKNCADPFLLREGKVDKNFIIKIRACQLLLLEEDLSMI